MRSAIALATLVAAATTARAQATVTPEARAEAKANYEEGARYYDEGRYDDAAAHFQKTFELTGAPEVLYNIAQAFRGAKKYDNAMLFYRSYLRRLPDAPNRDVVERRIEESRLAAEREKASAPPLRAPPSSATITSPTVAASGAPAPASIPAADNAARRATLRRAGYALAAVAVAGLVTGGALVGVSQSTQSKLESDSRAGTQIYTASLQGQYATAQAESTASIACFAVGGALAVTSVALLVAGTRRPARALAAIAPAFAPGRAALVVSGAF